MKKIQSLSVIMFISAAATLFASTPQERAAQEKENMKILASMGLPLPGSGIKIVPRAALDLSNEELETAQKEDEEIKTKGYIEKYTNRPLELLKLHKQIKKEKHFFATHANNPQYTGLSPSIKDLTLAFKFKGIKELTTLKRSLDASNDITVLAAAPQGGFHDDKGGWSGAAQYFDAKNIGSCDYSVMNVKASNTAAELAVEKVTYDINNKPTLLAVEGSNNSGFLYQIKWYDDENFHELECANMKYSSETTNSIIALAKKIDSN